MAGDGGGIVAATAPTTSRSLTSQHSTLQDSFFATDLAEALCRSNSNASIVNRNSSPTNPRPVSNLTLGAVLYGNKKSSPPNNVVVRTLLEIIRNEETVSSGGGSPNNKKSWKSFKERLKLKKSQGPNQNQIQNQNQNSSAGRWINSMPIPQSDVLPPSKTEGVILANRNSLRNSLRSSSSRRVDGVPADDLATRDVDAGGSPRSGGSFRLSAAVAVEREETRRRLSRELDQDANGDGNLSEDEGSGEEDGEEDEEEDEEGGADFGAPSNQPMRMSLMDLLEETDRQAGISGPTYRLEDDEEPEEEEEEEEAGEEQEEEGLGKGEFSCCVCMVRHKGAAFIPCGHTFCRMCSRELFVQRGNCPLCNNFILEILDIF